MFSKILRIEFGTWDFWGFFPKKCTGFSRVQSYLPLIQQADLKEIIISLCYKNGWLEQKKTFSSVKYYCFFLFQAGHIFSRFACFACRSTNRFGIAKLFLPPPGVAIAQKYLPFFPKNSEVFPVQRSTWIYAVNLEHNLFKYFIVGILSSAFVPLICRPKCGHGCGKRW